MKQFTKVTFLVTLGLFLGSSQLWAPPDDAADSPSSPWDKVRNKLLKKAPESPSEPAPAPPGIGGAVAALQKKVSGQPRRELPGLPKAPGIVDPGSLDLPQVPDDIFRDSSTSDSVALRASQPSMAGILSGQTDDPAQRTPAAPLGVPELAPVPSGIGGAAARGIAAKKPLGGAAVAAASGAPKAKPGGDAPELSPLEKMQQAYSRKDETAKKAKRAAAMGAAFGVLAPIAAPIAWHERASSARKESDRKLEKLKAEGTEAVDSLDDSSSALDQFYARGLGLKPTRLDDKDFSKKGVRKMRRLLEVTKDPKVFRGVTAAMRELNTEAKGDPSDPKTARARAQQKLLIKEISAERGLGATFSEKKDFGRGVELELFRTSMEALGFDQDSLPSEEAQLVGKKGQIRTAMRVMMQARELEEEASKEADSDKKAELVAEIEKLKASANKTGKAVADIKPGFFRRLFGGKRKIGDDAEVVDAPWWKKAGQALGLVKKDAPVSQADPLSKKKKPQTLSRVPKELQGDDDSEGKQPPTPMASDELGSVKTMLGQQVKDLDDSEFAKIPGVPPPASDDAPAPPSSLKVAVDVPLPDDDEPAEPEKSDSDEVEKLKAQLAEAQAELEKAKTKAPDDAADPRGAFLAGRAMGAWRAKASSPADTQATKPDEPQESDKPKSQGSLEAAADDDSKPKDVAPGIKKARSAQKEGKKAPEPLKEDGDAPQPEQDTKKKQTMSTDEAAKKIQALGRGMLARRETKQKQAATRPMQIEAPISDTPKAKKSRKKGKPIPPPPADTPKQDAPTPEPEPSKADPKRLKSPAQAAKAASRLRAIKTKTRSSDAVEQTLSKDAEQPAASDKPATPAKSIGGALTAPSFSNQPAERMSLARVEPPPVEQDQPKPQEPTVNDEDTISDIRQLWTGVTSGAARPKTAPATTAEPVKVDLPPRPSTAPTDKEVADALAEKQEKQLATRKVIEQDEEKARGTLISDEEKARQTLETMFSEDLESAGRAALAAEESAARKALVDALSATKPAPPEKSPPVTQVESAGAASARPPSRATSATEPRPAAASTQLPAVATTPTASPLPTPSEKKSEQPDDATRVAAATKIQAAFRGQRGRKAAQSMRATKNQATVPPTPADEQSKPPAPANDADDNLGETTPGTPNQAKAKKAQAASVGAAPARELTSEPEAAKTFEPEKSKPPADSDENMEKPTATKTFSRPTTPRQTTPTRAVRTKAKDEDETDEEADPAEEKAKKDAAEAKRARAAKRDQLKDQAQTRQLEGFKEVKNQGINDSIRSDRLMEAQQRDLGQRERTDLVFKNIAKQHGLPMPPTTEDDDKDDDNMPTPSKAEVFDPEKNRFLTNDELKSKAPTPDEVEAENKKLIASISSNIKPDDAPTTPASEPNQASTPQPDRLATLREKGPDKMKPAVTSTTPPVPAGAAALRQPPPGPPGVGRPVSAAGQTPPPMRPPVTQVPRATLTSGSVPPPQPVSLVATPSTPPPQPVSLAALSPEILALAARTQASASATSTQAPTPPSTPASSVGPLDSTSDLGSLQQLGQASSTEGSLSSILEQYADGDRTRDQTAADPDVTAAAAETGRLMAQPLSGMQGAPPPQDMSGLARMAEMTRDQDSQQYRNVQTGVVTRKGPDMNRIAQLAGQRTAAQRGVEAGPGDAGRLRPGMGGFGIGGRAAGPQSTSMETATRKGGFPAMRQGTVEIGRAVRRAPGSQGGPPRQAGTPGKVR